MALDRRPRTGWRTRLVPLAIAVLPLMVAGCAVFQTQPTGEGPQEVIGQASEPGTLPAINGERQWQGQNSGIVDRDSRVVRNSAGWRDLWADIGQEPPGSLPTGSMALAIFAGERPTGGYRVEIIEAETGFDALEVRFRLVEPGPDDMVTQAFTAPWVVAIAPVSYQPVIFRRVE